MTVVIIGHGKSLVGKGWGSRIDACDTVVRLWDNHWQDVPDWGCKYDYGYIELSPKQMSRMKFYNKNTPRLGWIGGLLKSATYELPPNTTIIKFGEWIELGKTLGGVGNTGKLKLTRGCAAACWAITHLKPDQVILVGLDNVRERRALTPEEGFPDAYRVLPSTSWKTYVGGGTKYHNHDYVAEGDILRVLSERTGVKLTHAQDTWVNG